MLTSRLNTSGLVLLFALGACGPVATRSHAAPVAPGPSPVEATASPVAAASPMESNPPAPQLPPAAAGPLPGQALPLSMTLSSPLLIQVENTAPARPQAGLGAASVVFQYLTEGGITRFSALFHRVPGVVGPVRSARFVSVNLFERFGALLMASGGGRATYQRIAATGDYAVINDFDRGVHFFRWSGRQIPHNVYTTQSMMLAAQAKGSRGPRAADFARGTAWSGVIPATVISVPQLRTEFNYAAGSYSVVSDGAPEVDVEFGPVRPVAVAVLHVPQVVTHELADINGVFAMDFNLTSGGAAEVYARGTVVAGSWASEPGRTGPMSLDIKGDSLPVPPGLLWVVLAP
ncbi:MAG: DUF3048 domain-containing protein [Candidatus Dormibacteria bacterium]